MPLIRPPIDSRHLRYFIAVAENLNFRRASESLHMAQPALTRQIKALESAVNVKLFNRNSHQVTLTPAGVVALQKAREILSRLDDLIDSTRRAAAGQAQTLRVGFASHAAYQFIPEIVRRFRSELPTVGVSLFRFLATLQFDSLLDRTADVAVLRPLYSDPRISTRIIRSTCFLAALPSGHHLLKKQALRMSDLRQDDFIMLPNKRGPNYCAQVIGFCLDAGFMPRGVLEMSDLQAVVGTVASGHGVAVVPEPTAALHISGVEYRPIIDLTQTADFAVAWRRDDRRELVQRFLELAVECASDWTSRDFRPARNRRPV